MPESHHRDQPRARTAWQTQSAHQQTTDSAASGVQSPTELQIAADGNQACMAQQDVSAGPFMQFLAPQPSQGHSPRTQRLDEHEQSEPVQQQDYPQQLSHQSGLHQLSQHECDRRQSQEHESEDYIELSCSLDDEIESWRLDLDCSAMSQLRSAVVNSAACTTHDKAPEAMTEILTASGDLPRMPSLTVRTGHAQEAGNYASRSLLDQEMAVSPSAQPAKKKQAKPSSTRCLKF